MTDFIINKDSPNICNNKLNLTYDSINNVENTYLQTIYYKTIPILDNESVSYSAEYNYNNYDIFCLNTNLSPVLGKLGFYFEYMSREIEGKMVLCILLKNSEGIVVMSDNLKQTLQNEVDYVCKNLYHMCLLFDPSENYNLPYSKNWIYNIFLYLEMPIKYNPSFVNNKLYISLDERIDYIESYKNGFDFLLNLLVQYYSNGIISCDNVFASKFNLEKYYDNLYIPNWNDTRITNDRVNFLLYLLYEESVILNILPDSFNNHYISRKYTDITFTDTEIIIKIPDYNFLIELTQYLSDFHNYEHIYSLFTFKVHSQFKANKILQVLTNIDPELELLYYKYADSNYPYIVSIYINKLNYDFSKIVQIIKSL